MKKKTTKRISGQAKTTPVDCLPAMRKGETVANVEDILLQSALSGDAQSARALAILYLRGRYVDKSIAKGIDWLARAAETGDLKSQFHLGLRYFKGIGVDQSSEQCSKWFRLAAEQGHASAQNRLGNRYLKGEGVPQSFTEAARWYRLAAQQGYARAQHNLALRYDRGEGVPQSFEEAVNWYQLAAEQGVPQAQNNLGARYANGDGVPQSFEDAVKWYRLAAEQGVPQAQYNLAVRYAKGEGAPQSSEEAAKWYRLAANQGNQHAQYSLALRYATGDGVPQSFEEAVEWCRRAADQGYAPAQANLAKRYVTGQGVSQSFADALHWYRLAAEQGHVESMLMAGILSIPDLGLTPGDAGEAIRWLDRAADNGRSMAAMFASCIPQVPNVRERLSRSVQLLYRLLDNGAHEHKLPRIPRCAKWFLERLDHLAATYPQALVLLSIVRVLGATKMSGEFISSIHMTFLEAQRRGDPVAAYLLQFLYEGVAEKQDERIRYLKQVIATVGKLFDQAPDADDYDVESPVELNSISQSQDCDNLDAESLSEQSRVEFAGYQASFLRELGWLAQTALSEIQATKLAQLEQEKREAVENIMAMFAHKFRGPVDSILFNSEHQHDERVYIDAARTMNGLLEIFSVVSTSPEKLSSSLKHDFQGDTAPADVLLHAFMLTLVQLLSARNRRRMSPHYLAYAKRQGLVADDVHLPQWARDESFQACERALQRDWEAQIGAMITIASHESLTDWMATHLVPIRIEGFRESRLLFAKYGPKASLLTVILTEILVNAIKHSEAGALEAIVVSWTEDVDKTVFACSNPSSRASRVREASKGSGRGHKFLKLIAEGVQGEFVADVFKDASRVTMTFSNEIIGKGDGA